LIALRTWVAFGTFTSTNETNATYQADSQETSEFVLLFHFFKGFRVKNKNCFSLLNPFPILVPKSI
jgi:hypothetical protein